MIYDLDNIIFQDRDDAGKQLGKFLKGRYKHLDPLVLGMPRGGVVIAYHVAKALEAELGMVIAKKLPLPDYFEIGFGAIAEDLSVYVFPK